MMHSSLSIHHRLPIKLSVLSSREVYDFRLADFGSLRQDFSQVDWSDIYLSDAEENRLTSLLMNM